eukprot:Opistho-1_new@64279
MGLFDFFRRKRGRPEMSRIDYLLKINHDQLEGREKAYDGLNFLQLIERQLEKGETDLAIWNLGNQVQLCFQLANLYWGQGEMARAEAYLRQTLERHDRMVRACAELGMARPSYSELQFAICAARLLGIEVEDLKRAEAFDPGYESWFKDVLISLCIGEHVFDAGEWQANVDLWTRRRFAKYRIAEFDFYLTALTGGFASTEAMFDAHRRLVAGRAKRNSFDWGLLDGYQDSELIIDHLFAAVLKRIGWEGQYRHSWPQSDAVDTPALTTRQPDAFVATIAAPPPVADDTGIIADAAAARRFIDQHVASQRDEEGTPVDATRPAKERGKVAAALKALGWLDDAASLELMRAYRMSDVLNDSAGGLRLCDPVSRDPVRLAEWTRVMRDDFGMHPDFIAIVESEERRDYLDPQGGWYVRWQMDGNIYMVQRDSWDRPEIATRDARMGLTRWPTYTSFVAWWVTEHMRGPR